MLFRGTKQDSIELSPTRTPSLRSRFRARDRQTIHRALSRIVSLESFSPRHGDMGKEKFLTYAERGECNGRARAHALSRVA
jgi:hypothetical protein